MASSPARQHIWRWHAVVEAAAGYPLPRPACSAPPRSVSTHRRVAASHDGHSSSWRAARRRAAEVHPLSSDAPCSPAASPVAAQPPGGRFPHAKSGRAPATIASRNITWRAPTSRGARPCPELVQGGRLARLLSGERWSAAVLSASGGAARRSNLKMTAHRSRSPRLRGAAPLTREAGGGDEENHARQKPAPPWCCG